ncbi:hypothetical protein BDFB_009846 [Asbolus verrucosus]|uniref:Uncharacterized protein n=1 Tax=Asbolus verrucosus TaxID=1661398 RepID=A0A482WE82_ASBVE|nr:hypothetical protein BDFB_009846 [Asbolus verrucosus]
MSTQQFQLLIATSSLNTNSGANSNSAQNTQGNFAECKSRFSGRKDEDVEAFIEAITIYKYFANVSDPNALRGLPIELFSKEQGDREPTDIFVNNCKALMSKLKEGDDIKLPDVFKLDMTIADTLKSARENNEVQQDKVKSYADQRREKFQQFETVCSAEGRSLIRRRVTPVTYEVATREETDTPLGKYHVSALRPFVDENGTTQPLPVVPIRKRGRPKKTDSAAPTSDIQSAEQTEDAPQEKVVGTERRARRLPKRYDDFQVFGSLHEDIGGLQRGRL